jgi:hypothetical protein
MAENKVGGKSTWGGRMTEGRSHDRLYMVNRNSAEIDLVSKKNLGSISRSGSSQVMGPTWPCQLEPEWSVV